MVNLEGNSFQKEVLHVLTGHNQTFWTILERIPYKKDLKLDILVLHGLGKDKKLERCKLTAQVCVYGTMATQPDIEEGFREVLKVDFPKKEYAAGQDVYTKECVGTIEMP